MPYALGDHVTQGIIYRRIPPDESYFSPDHKKITSQVFLPQKDEVTGEEGTSAYLAVESGGQHTPEDLAQLKTPEQVLAGHPRFGLAKISVEKVISAGFKVTYDPDPKHGGPGHVWITRNLEDGKETRKKSLSAFRDLSRAAELMHEPMISIN